LRGNLIRITPVDGLPSDGLATAGLFTTTPTFTIRNETVQVAPPPLSITAAATNMIISWPLVNQPFAVESADSLLGPYSATTNEPAIDDTGSSISIPLAPQAGRFFRLRLASSLE